MSMRVKDAERIAAMDARAAERRYGAKLVAEAIALLEGGCEYELFREQLHGVVHENSKKARRNARRKREAERAWLVGQLTHT